MSLRFEVVLTVEVDESANFLEVIEDSTLEVVKEKISDALYDVDDLEGFRLNHLNMTFNGWPRSTSGEENHASMTRDTCAEIWQELVDDRWKEGFITTAEVGNLGLCRFTAINMEGVVEYDVRRGRVKLTVG